jgi:hypothetical protein
MECVNLGIGASSMSRVLSVTFSSINDVRVFLASAEEIKIKANTKEDSDYAVDRSRLSSVLNELYTFVRAIEMTPWSEQQPVEIVLNKLMTFASFLWGCLVDLDIHSRQSQSSRSISSQQVYESQSHMPAYYGSPMGSPRSEFCATASTRESMLSDTTSIFTVGSQVSPSTPRRRGFAESLSTSPHVRKFASTSALNERYKEEACDFTNPEKEKSHLFSESTYGEGTDLRESLDFYRTSHDSAVVMSTRCTPHQSLVADQKGPTTQIPVIVDEVSIETDQASISGNTIYSSSCVTI